MTLFSPARSLVSRRHSVLDLSDQNIDLQRIDLFTKENDIGHVYMGKLYFLNTLAIKAHVMYD